MCCYELTAFGCIIVQEEDAERALQEFLAKEEVVCVCGCVVVCVCMAVCVCVVVWLCGCVVVCVCVVVWLYGCMCVWLYVCVVVWLCGCGCTRVCICVCLRLRLIHTSRFPSRNLHQEELRKQREDQEKRDAELAAQLQEVHLGSLLVLWLCV